MKQFEAWAGFMPDYVRVYTGHGMMTTIKDEKMLNPFAVE